VEFSTNLAEEPSRSG